MNEFLKIEPELVLEILGFTRYDQIDWENVESHDDLLMNREMLQKTYDFTNYIDYVYHQISFYEIFDLPNAVIDKIIDSIPLHGLSQFLKLSEQRIERYAEYLNGQLVALNKSLTPDLFRKYKDKLDIFVYYQQIDIDEESFLKIIEKANEKVKEGTKRGSRTYLELILELDGDRYNIFKNPKVIPFLKDFNFSKIMNLNVKYGKILFNNTGRIVDNVMNLSVHIFGYIALNPALDLKILKRCLPFMKTKDEMNYFKYQCSTNPFISDDIIEYLKKDYINTILSHHLLTDEFMKKYRSLYKGTYEYLFNPCINDQESDFSDSQKMAELYARNNPLARPFKGVKILIPRTIKQYKETLFLEYEYPLCRKVSYILHDMGSRAEITDQQKKFFF